MFPVGSLFRLRVTAADSASWLFLVSLSSIEALSSVLSFVRSSALGRVPLGAVGPPGCRPGPLAAVTGASGGRRIRSADRFPDGDPGAADRDHSRAFPALPEQVGQPVRPRSG